MRSNMTVFLMVQLLGKPRKRLVRKVDFGGKSA